MNRIFSILFFLLFTSLTNLNGANKTFTGPGNFSDPTKWNLGALPIAGDNLRINGTCTFDNASNNLVYGTLNVGFGAAGTLNWPVGGTNTLNVTAVSSSTAGSAINMTNGGILKITTSWTTTNQTFTAGTGTIYWNNTAGASSIPLLTYNNLTIDVNTRVATLLGAITVNGNLLISTGTLASSTFQITGNATGTFTMSAATSLTLGTTASATVVNFPTLFTAANTTLNSASTVTYQCNAAQTISSTPTYGNLTVSVGAATVTKTISASPLTIAGNLTVTGATLTFRITTSTINLTGNLSGTGGLSFSTGTLNIKGNNTQTGTFTPGTGTVNYNGTAAQAIRGTTYYNLTYSGSNTGTLGAATVVNNNLVVSAGTFAPTTRNLTVTGTTTLSTATYNDASNTGTNTFTGLVTINAGGTWTSTSTTTAGRYVFRGGITNNGTAFSAGIATFNTNAQVLSGSIAFGFTNAITVTGVVVTNNATVNMTNTGAGMLAGTGTWRQGVNSTLNYRGSTITVSTVDFSTSTPNTVNYNGTGAQTIRGATYYNITYSGTSTGTLGAAVTVNNNLNVTSGTLASATFQITGNATGTFTMSAGTNLFLGTTASATVVSFPTLFTTANTTLNLTSTVTYRCNAAQVISNTPTYGNLTVSTGAATVTKTISASPLTVARDLTITGATLTFSAAATSINLTGNLSGTGGLSFSTGTLNIKGNNTQSGTFTAGTGTVNYNGTAAQAIRGTTYYNLTYSGTNTGTLGAATVVNNNLVISGGTFAPTTRDLTVTGTTTLSTATYNDASNTGTNTFTGLVTINAGATWTSTTSTTTGTYDFRGGITNNGTSFAAGGATFSTNAQALAGSTAFGFANIVTVTGITVTNNGTVNMTNTGAAILTGTGTWKQGANSSLNYRGSTVAVSTVDFSTSTPNIVTYNSTLAQTIRGSTYYNLTYSGTNTGTLGAAVIINNNLSVTSGTLASSTFQITGNATGTFTMSAATSLTLGTTASATVVNFPTLFTTANTTLNSASTVTYQCNAAQTISSTPTYGNLIVTTGASTVTKIISASPLTVAGNLTINGATLTLDAATSTINLTGNLSGTGGLSFTTGTLNINGNNTQTGTFTSGTGTVNYNRNGAQTVRTTNYYNLTFSTAGTKTFSVGTTGIAGNLSISGSAVADATTNTTTINFNGSLPQTISGNSTDFYNINIATGASVSLSSAQRLIQTITLNGTGQFNTNNQLTLVSTASATGNIAALATPANFTGNITMQRYTSGTMGYRYIGSPISGATLSGLTPEIQLDGMTGGSNPTYWCNVYTYNEAATGVFANGWTAATNVTNPMSAGKGFAVYYYSINIPVTTDLSGPPNKGNQTLPVTYTSTPHADDGWNLVSNPYPSTIDWDAAVGWTRTNIQGNTVYCWNNASQNYASYPAGGPGVNGGTRYIASSQGFMVRANAAGPVLNMTESVKTSNNPSPQFWKVSGTPDPYAIKLKLSGNANSYRDESVIRFMSGALDKKDMGFDADKLTSTNAAAPYLATLSADSIALCVNSQPDFSVSNEIKIPVMVRAGVSGTYTITVELLNQFPLSACLILEDLSNGIKTTIKTDSSYSFTLATTSTPVKRFMLHISPPLINIKTEDITCHGLNNGSIIINGGSGAAGSWNYMLLDSTGKVIASKNNTTYVDTIRNLAAGKYKITSYDSTAYCSNRSETIIISQPTPILISTLSSAVSCSGMNDGSLSASASGGSGTYSYQWSNGALTEQITGLLAGTYTLTVKDGNNCYVSKTSSVLDGTFVKADFTMSNDTIYLLGTDSVHFTNKSIGATSFIWDFGDSTYSTDNDPTHSYSKVGTYTVKLYTFNTGCKDSIQYNITVLLSIPLLVLENTSDQVNAYCADGFLLINWSVPLDDKILIRVLNGLGQEIYISEYPKTTSVSTYKIDMSAYSPGIYFINFISPKNHLTKKINYFK